MFLSVLELKIFLSKQVKIYIWIESYNIRHKELSTYHRSYMNLSPFVYIFCFYNNFLGGVFIYFFYIYSVRYLLIIMLWRDVKVITDNENDYLQWKIEIVSCSYYYLIKRSVKITVYHKPNESTLCCSLVTQYTIYYIILCL